MDNAQLYHWGIKGMKWGVRRFQNSDGSLTAAGRKRYSDGDSSDTDSSTQKGVSTTRKTSSSSTEAEPSKPKSISEMSDAELRSAVARMQLEQQYKSLLPREEKTVSAGQKFLKAVGNTVGPAIGEASKTLIKDYMIKAGKEKLGLTEKKEKKEPSRKDKLSEEVKILTLEKQYKTLTGKDYED